MKQYLLKRFLKYLFIVFVFFCVSWGVHFTYFTGGEKTTSLVEKSSVLVVFAQENNLSPEPKDTLISAKGRALEAQQKFIQTLETILRILYLLIWPLLAIAGASMDNSLVYGSIFYLDTMLWKFWQIIRTFANFSVGFIFIASILASFFGHDIAGKKLVDVLKNTFIAGILIQMSRWIFAVFIDLSTIGVIAAGALPLGVAGEQIDKNPLSDVRFLKMHAVYNLDVEKEKDSNKGEHNIIYNCEKPGAGEGTGEYFIPCLIKDGKLVGTIENKNDPYSWKAYKDEFIATRGKKSSVDLEKNPVSDEYCVYGYDLLKTSDTTIPVTCAKISELKTLGIEEMKNNCSKIDELIEGASGMTGPFYTLFATVMKMGNIAVTTNTQGLVSTSLTFLMKSLIGIALIIPLFALAVVLVVRAIILWLLIAFSPFLALIYVYKFNLDGAKIGGGNITNIKDVLGLIFMPVAAVFAISMSLVFLSLLTRKKGIDRPMAGFACIHLVQNGDVKSDNTGEEGKKKEVSCTDDTDMQKACYDFCGITEICIEESTSTIGTNIVDTFGWLIINFFGIALMWTIVFAALKTSKITGGIAGTIQGRGKLLASTVPILPGGISLGALNKTKDTIKSIPGQMAQDQRNSSSAKDLTDRLLGRGSGNNENLQKNLDVAIKNGDKNLANTNIESTVPQGHDYTTLGEEKLAKNYAIASGLATHQVGNISTMKDALGDKVIINHMIKNNHYDKIVGRLVQTSTKNAVRPLTNDIRAGLGANRLVGSIKTTTNGSAELYKETEGFVQYLVDQDGKFKSLKSYSISSNLSEMSSAEEIKEFGRLIVDYDNIDNIPADPRYNTLITNLKTAFPNADVTEKVVGNNKISVTKNSSNIITGIASVQKV